MNRIYQISIFIILIALLLPFLASADETGDDPTAVRLTTVDPETYGIEFGQVYEYTFILEDEDIGYYSFSLETSEDGYIMYEDLYLDLDEPQLLQEAAGTVEYSSEMRPVRLHHIEDIEAPDIPMATGHFIMVVEFMEDAVDYDYTRDGEPLASGTANTIGQVELTENNFIGQIAIIESMIDWEPGNQFIIPSWHANLLIPINLEFVVDPFMHEWEVDDETYECYKVDINLDGVYLDTHYISTDGLLLGITNDEKGIVVSLQ